MACNWLMMTSFGDDMWPSENVGLLTDKKKNKQDLLGLITVLLKFNYSFSTTVAAQCIFQSSL